MGENALAAYAVGFTTGIAVTALAASYHYVWRNRLVNWGATAAEARPSCPATNSARAVSTWGPDPPEPPAVLVLGGETPEPPAMTW